MATARTALNTRPTIRTAISKSIQYAISPLLVGVMISNPFQGISKEAKNVSEAMNLYLT